MWDRFALVSEDSEVKEEMLSSNAVYSDCYPLWHLMNVYHCIPLYPSFTVEVYFCLYSLRTQVHSTSDFVRIHNLFLLKYLLVLLLLSCIRKDPYRCCPPLALSLRHKDTHADTHTDQDFLSTSNRTDTQFKCRTCLLDQKEMIYYPFSIPYPQHTHSGHKTLTNTESLLH